MMSEYTDENFVPEKNRYAETLSEFIKCKTISDERFFDKTEFDKFLSFIKGRFPLVFEKGEYKDFNGGIMIKIDGKIARRTACTYVALRRRSGKRKMVV